MVSNHVQCEFVKFHSKGPVRIVELDRPKALHAINLEMIEAILEALQNWESNPTCKMVVLKSNNTETKSKAFCSGGDVVGMQIYEIRSINSRIAIATSEAPILERAKFFRREYLLNHLIGTYKKPIISILDGITSRFHLFLL